MNPNEIYPKKIIPTIKRLGVGEEVIFEKERSLSIRSSIYNYCISSNRRYETRTENGELIVKRVEDIVPNYEYEKIDPRKAASQRN